MYSIKTLNSISPVYQDALPNAEYAVSADVRKSGRHTRAQREHARHGCERQRCCAWRARARA